MAYVGNSPAEIYSSVQKQTITGDGTVGPYTLDYPASTNDVSVFVNNVRQEPTVAYTVSGTSMTMTGTVSSSDDFYVVFSGLTQGTITPPDGSVTDAKIDTMAATKLTGTIDSARFPSGSILQTQYTMFTGTSTTAFASATNTKLTDLAVNITPTSTNSVIKIEAFVTGELSNASSIYNTGWFFFRDNTALQAQNVGNRNAGIQMASNLSYWAGDVSSTPENASYMYFDSPSTTSQITYTVGIVSYYGGNWHLNRTVSDSNDSDNERGISSICVTEIAG